MNSKTKGIFFNYIFLLLKKELKSLLILSLIVILCNTISIAQNNINLNNTHSRLLRKKKWIIDTISYNDGSKDIIKKRFLNQRGTVYSGLKVIKCFDKCGNLIRKSKIIEYHSCHGIRENVIYDKRRESQCSHD